MLKIMAATATFAAVHSLLASRNAKRAAASTFGERNRNGLYRVFYIAQSAVAFGMLAAYIRKQPSRELYRVGPPLSLLMHGAQLGAIVYATSAAKQVGIARMLGIESVRAWIGDGPVPAEPEAQGPAFDSGRHPGLDGPFARSRHPLNFAPLPILWLWPKMTTSLLAFNTAASIYLVVGSLHEEFRLREAFTEEYQAYQMSGVPLFLPRPARSLDVGGRDASTVDIGRAPTNVHKRHATR